jgi:pre-mRNA-splicing factor SYF1
MSSLLQMVSRAHSPVWIVNSRSAALARSDAGDGAHVRIACCSLCQDTHSLGYEESILRDPYSLQHWLNYLDFKASSKSTAAVLQQRWLIYERAVRVLPGSYKLWMRYLKERISHTHALCPTSAIFDEVNNLFERCLVHLHKMPLVWVAYLDFLKPQYKLTRIRRTFDRMLSSIAVTQHDNFVWPAYLAWATSSQLCGVPETGVRVYKRYLKVNPLALEDYVKFLKRCGRLEDAALELTKLVNDESFVSQRGKSRHELWTELLHLLVRNPMKMAHSQVINVDAIIRSGISRFAHEVGRLWTNLADYYIRLGQFEKARDIYEESIHEVRTVRDFSLVFDAYSKFEESLLNAKMKEVEEGAAEEDEEKKDDLDEKYRAKNDEDEMVLQWYTSGGVVTAAQPELMDIEIDLSMARLDHLLSRRPLLLSSVILRQNPHHVGEWSNRVALFPDDPLKQVEVYTHALQTIDPFQANNGKLERLWIAFAKFYEKHDDLENARIIYQKASSVNFKHVDALTAIWTEWIEMELRHGKYEKALETVKKALVVPAGLNRQNLGWSGGAKEKGAAVENLTCQQRLYKSTKLWSLYADLSENFDTLEATKAVYDQMFFLKIITPALVLAYASLMWDHKFFSDTFRIYEKGLQVFEYPHSYPIWMQYLHQFITRYGQGTGHHRKLERIRDLFEQALKTLPPSAIETKKLYLLYAKYEEDQGLARRAMDIYKRACEAIAPAERYELYIIYLARCAHRFGLARTREIYELAIKNLPDAHVKAMAIKYARLERTLGEIDRARAIYTYSSQFCDPRVDQQFWSVWSEFEVAHGNQDTFKDMLRVKRSVLGQFASHSIVASSTPSLSLRPENSILQPSRIPGSQRKEKEREEKKRKAGEQREEEKATAAAAGQKRRREEEEAAEEEEEKKTMGAAARIAHAREQQRESEESGEGAPAAEGEINLHDDDDAGSSSNKAAAAEGEINLDDDEEEADEPQFAVKAVPDAVFGLGGANTAKTK